MMLGFLKRDMNAGLLDKSLMCVCFHKSQSVQEVTAALTAHLSSFSFTEMCHQYAGLFVFKSASYFF